jgi:hypothetical protein
MRGKTEVMLALSGDRRGRYRDRSRSRLCRSAKADSDCDCDPDTDTDGFGGFLFLQYNQIYALISNYEVSRTWNLPGDLRIDSYAA